MFKIVRKSKIDEYESEIESLKMRLHLANLHVQELEGNAQPHTAERFRLRQDLADEIERREHAEASVKALKDYVSVLKDHLSVLKDHLSLLESIKK